MMYIFQERAAFIYQGKSPTLNLPEDYEVAWLPEDLGMQYDNITVQSDSYTLHGWFVHHGENTKSKETIIYFHENDYFPPARLHTIKQLHSVKKEYNVVMVDYRGYGLSEGSPSEEAMYEDAENILQYVLQMPQIDPYKVYIMGCSLGGVAAVNVAEKHQDKIRGLILQNTIESVEALTAHKMWFLKPILPYMLRLEMRNIDLIPKMTVPIMFIISIDDPNTPAVGMYKLYNAAKSTVYRKIYEIHSNDHYFPYEGIELQYATKISHFVESCNSEQIHKQHLEALK